MKIRASHPLFSGVQWMRGGPAAVTCAYRKEGLLSALLNRDPGPCHPRRKLRIQLLLILSSLVFFTVTPGEAREPKARKVLGVTLEVLPTSVTILAVDGTEITVIPTEDFTEKVAVGSQVTVWYVPEGAVNRLRWLQYPFENFFSPRTKSASSSERLLFCQLLTSRTRAVSLWPWRSTCEQPPGGKWN